MENERIQMNENENTAVDSVSNLVQVSEGMSGSLFGILSLTDLLSSNSLAMGISTVSLLAQSTEIKTGVGSLIEAAGSAISPVGIIADGMINLLGYADQMCNGIAMIAENTTKDPINTLGSLGSMVSGIATVGSSLGSIGTNLLRNFIAMPLGSGKDLAFLAMFGATLVAVVAIGVCLELVLKNQEKTREAINQRLNQIYPDGDASQTAGGESTPNGTEAQPQAAPSGDGGASQVGNLSQTITSGVVTVQEAALEGLGLTSGTLSLAPEIVNLTLDTLNVIVQGTSSFVFQQGVNFGLAGLELRYSPVWGAPVAARPGTLPAVRPKTLADECKTFRELDYEAGLAGRTRPQASVENNSSTSNVSHSSSENSVTSEWGAQNYHTFAPVFHMYGLTIKHESDFEEVAAYLAERLHDAMKTQPAGSYTNQSGGSASRDK